MNKTFYQKYSITDAKVLIRKSAVFILGESASVLLEHLLYGQDTEFRSLEYAEGELWQRQTIEWMSYQSGLTQSAVKRAKRVLEEAGLLFIRQQSSFDRTTFWRVDEEKVQRFFHFASAVRESTRPDRGKSFSKWLQVSKEMPELIEEFGFLYTRKIKPVTTIDIPIFTKDDYGIKPEVKKDTFVCPFVEYWNKKQHVPKTKQGTETYRKIAKFLDNLRLCKIRSTKNQPFSDETLQYMQVDKINKTSQRKGSTRPQYTDEELYSILDNAALFYDPNYAPANKKSLPSSFSQFIYTTHHSRIRPNSSYLLETIFARPLIKIEQAREQDIMASLADDETAVLNLIKQLYNKGNDRKNKDLAVRDLSKAQFISKCIIESYLEFDLKNPTIRHHLGDFFGFLESYERYVTNHDLLWDGMPISSFHPEKRIWQKFVDHMNKQMGIDIITGELLE